MSITASEAFGLFLTALRNRDVEILLSDKETAQLVIDSLDIIDPADGPTAVTADALRIELESLIEADLFVDDNGAEIEQDTN